MLGWQPEEVFDPADPEVSFPDEFVISPSPDMPPAVFDIEELRQLNEAAMLRIVARNEAARAG